MSTSNYWEHPDWWTDPEADGPEVAFVAERTAGDVLRDTAALLRAHGVEFALGVVVLTAPLALLNALVSMATGEPHLTGAALTNIALSGLVDFAAWGDGAGLRWLAQHALSIATLAVASGAAFAYLSLYTQGQSGGITPDVLGRTTRPLLAPMLGSYAALTGVLLMLGLLARLPFVGALFWVVGLALLVAVGGLLLVALAYEAAGLRDALGRLHTLDLQHRWRPSLGVVAVAVGSAVVAQPGVFVLAVVARMGAAVGGGVGGAVLLAVEVLGLALVPLMVLPIVAATFAYGHLLALAQPPREESPHEDGGQGDAGPATAPLFEATPAGGLPGGWD
ncbi:MAG: hypothetical protein AAF624_08645 [Bacteroidota bacterium]